MKRLPSLILFLLLLAMLSLTACSGKTGLQDGYYTAQAAMAGRNISPSW